MFKVSHSKMNTYLQCRYKYYLSYVLELRAIKESKALTVGKEYHTDVENIINGSEPETMLGSAFAKHSGYRNWGVIETEKEILHDLGDNIFLHGFIDGITDTHLIEHKTTKSALDEKYIYKLKWNNQPKLYSGMTGIRKIKWTAIQKPTIRKHKPTKKKPEGETDLEYDARCKEWLTEDRLLIHNFTLTHQEVANTMKQTKALAVEMRAQTLFPRNPMACAIMGCDFADICLSKDPECSIGYEKKEKR